MNLTLVLMLFGVLSDVHQAVASKNPTKRWPVIGVLAQSANPDLRPHGESYIYSAYVKFIEQAGALVIPIRINESAEYYEGQFEKLNGVVFPGGGVGLVTSPFAKAAEYFFNMSIKANDNGDFFPILGICLGFEELTVRRTISNKMVRCSGSNYAASLNFTHDARESRLFSDLPDYLYKALSMWNLTYNNHVYCMTPQVFKTDSKLFNFYKVISTNVDKDGLEFISTMEAYRYPFYGTQWHPEKNIYLWSDANVNHSALAVQFTQYIADFFVTQARKSQHVYPETDLNDSVIFNYEPKYMGAPSFHNIYFFQTTEISELFRIESYCFSSQEFILLVCLILTLANLIICVMPESCCLRRGKQKTTHRVAWFEPALDPSQKLLTNQK